MPLDKMLLEKIRNNDTTLTSLGLGYNRIGAAQLQKINTLIQSNQQMMLARRQQFLYKLIMLARNARNSNPDSLWTKLPKEIRFHILNFINLCGEAHIDKTAKQIEQGAQFIFANIDECYALIKAKQKIKLSEKKLLMAIINFNSSNHQYFLDLRTQIIFLLHNKLIK